MAEKTIEKGGKGLESEKRENAPSFGRGKKEGGGDRNPYF